MIAVIICNGSIEDYAYHHKYLQKADFIICADGGARHTGKLNVKPDIVLGDFDSISEEELAGFKTEGTEIIRYPVHKDKTDTELAIETAIGRGFKTIILLGALGTRFDHSLSNVFLLKKMLDMGVKGIIANEYNEITLTRDSVRVEREEGMKVTLLPLSGSAKGVNIKGFVYPLVDATLEVGSTWGVSNETVAAAAEVSVQEGILLVIKSRD